MLVKTDYFLHSKLELHRYQYMNGFLYWQNFYWRNYGTYISLKLIVRLIPTWIWYHILTVSQIWLSNHQLIPTWIWYDLLTVSQIWPSNLQLSYIFLICQFKVAKLEGIALQSVVLMLLCLLWTGKIHK